MVDRHNFSGSIDNGRVLNEKARLKSIATHSLMNDIKVNGHELCLMMI